jgi:hypothetical protein
MTDKQLAFVRRFCDWWEQCDAKKGSPSEPERIAILLLAVMAHMKKPDADPADLRIIH